MRSRLKSSNFNFFFCNPFFILLQALSGTMIVLLDINPMFIISFLIVVICADPDTFANAQKNPEKYDLIRVRTGGWNEFYITFFTAHQKHVERRIYYHVSWSTTRTAWAFGWPGCFSAAEKKISKYLSWCTIKIQIIVNTNFTLFWVSSSKRG